MAQLTRDGFVTELQSRGWSRFVAADLQRYCDWGLRDVIREAKWKDQLIIVSFSTSLDSVAFSAIDGTGAMREIQHMYRTTTNDEIRLKPQTDEDFFEKRIFLDVTNSGNKGAPTQYYVYNKKVYFWPFPDKSYTFSTHYNLRSTAFGSGATPSPLPERFDEAILCAIESHCFRRAREWEAMAVAQSEMRRIVLAEIVEDEQIMPERERGVVPHR